LEQLQAETQVQLKTNMHFTCNATQNTYAVYNAMHRKVHILYTEMKDKYTQKDKTKDIYWICK